MGSLFMTRGVEEERWRLLIRCLVQASDDRGDVGAGVGLGKLRLKNADDAFDESSC